MLDRRAAQEKVVSDNPYFALESIEVRGIPWRVFRNAPASMSDVALIGVPHETWGEEVVAVVEAQAGAEVTGAELQDHVAGRLARFKVPTRFRSIAEPLPRTATGKVLKRDRRDRFSPVSSLTFAPRQATQPERSRTQPW